MHSMTMYPDFEPGFRRGSKEESLKTTHLHFPLRTNGSKILRLKVRWVRKW